MRATADSVREGRVSRRHLRTLLSALGSFILVLSGAFGASATPEKAGRSSRARLSSFNTVTVSPLLLQGGSQLTVISPEPWMKLADTLLKAVEDTHKDFIGFLGPIPALTASVRLLDEDSFFGSTGAPSWTNALFYRGEILIPLGQGAPLDLPDLLKAVRHEYVHAILHSLSGGRCPGWLDEGLAQWSEGQENSALQPALHRWLSNKRPLPLQLLQGGFTKLETAMVPAAYAQSLFTTHYLLRTHGFSAIREYLNLLKAGREFDDAFNRVFGVANPQFEKNLAQVLTDWHSRRAPSLKSF